ncbi:unnamed protein product [Allacma fusca]|uniref:Uncharacterized protein n=1 Tax=Allacma fusca TaxID=39272 RepID=A0A8J2P3C5_9HEXA|nr:unnamed protein product [Allacma fusca]
MPGGMKLVIDGNTYSFKTDLCSGGIFFKQPVHIELSCLHGYYLKRPNGCSMEGNSIISGQNYACQRVNKDKSKMVQALVPVTNPDQPLDHTLTFFDDPNTLKNLRRYTYVRGLEGAYEDSGSDPVGVIVTNPQKTPKINIAKLCYQAKAPHTASSYMSRLPRTVNLDVSTTKIFTRGCDSGSVAFPWGKETVFNFTEGYSAQDIFSNEIMAVLSGVGETSVPQITSHEIWGGLAYCLQANTQVSSTGTIKMRGIQPPLESLQSFCSKPSGRTAAMVPGQKRKRRSLRRKTRDVETSIEFNTLMTCVSTCWKNNADKCHENPPQANQMPFCPPYCGGKKRTRHHESDPDFVGKKRKREAPFPFNIPFKVSPNRFKRKYPAPLNNPNHGYGPSVVMKMF